MTKDMTTGSITKNVVSFSLPVIVTLLCQTLFSTADQIMMGRYVSQTALGSVGSCGSTTLMFMMLANGFAVGYKIVIGRYFGAKRFRHVKEAIYTSFFVMGGITVFLSVSGFFLSPLFLKMLNTVPELYDGAVLYLKYYFLFIGFIIFRGGINNIYYALGETKIPMFFQIAQITIHIEMDFLFLKFLHLGIPGVILAGVISRGTTLVPLIVLLIRRIRPYPKVRHLFNTSSFKKIVKFALPSCLANAISAIQTLFVTNLINSFGAAVVTGNSIASNINNLCFIITNAIASGAGSFAAQNFGARSLHRIKKCGIICFGINLLYCLSIILIISLFGPGLISLYMSSNYDPAFAAEVKNFAQNYLMCVSIFYLVYGAGHVCNEMLRSVGKIKITTIAMVFSIVARVSFGYGFAPFLGERALYYSIVASWLATYVYTSIYFFSGRWTPHFKSAHTHTELLSNRESLKEQLHHLDR